jgi:hypothetical protein
MLISQLARLLRSRLWDRFLTWAADGRPASYFIAGARRLDYQISDELARQGRQKALAEFRLSGELADLTDDDRLSRGEWERKRAIHHAYEVTARTEYCDDEGDVVAARRDTVGFDRNPTGAEIRAALENAAEDRLQHGTDPRIKAYAVEICGQTITEAWRRTA